MLQLKDFEKNIVLVLVNLKDYHVVETLDGNETLYFSLPISDPQNQSIKLEFYVENNKNRYVIKEKHSAGDWYNYVCQLDLEDFNFNLMTKDDGIPHSLFEHMETLISAMSSGIVYGWTFTCPDTVAKYVYSKHDTHLERLIKLKNAFGMEVKINTLNKTITIKKQLGQDRGCYFSEELNLKKLEIDSDTNNYVTNICPIGKDGLGIESVNGGNATVFNVSYGKTQPIMMLWEDERYTNAKQLKEDAISKLEELSKPQTTYQIDVVDLANASDEYNMLTYSIGDTVTLFNRKENQRQTHRIVEIDSYPDEPSRNTCQLSSRAHSIIGVQKQSFITTDSFQGKAGLTKSNGDGTVTTAVPGTDYAIPPADYVVGQGTANGWYYHKWNSGKTECWKHSVSVNSAKDDRQSVSPTNNIALPFPFKSVINCQITAYGNSWKLGRIYLHSLNNGNSLRIVCYHDAGVVETTATDQKISIYFVGTWK